MFNVDQAPSYRLNRPPLVQAFGQVRFPVRAKLPTLEGIASVQERLDTVFPYLAPQQTQQLSLLVTPGGASAAAEGQMSQSWRFADDEGWTMVLGADVATLAAGPEYGDFSAFSGKFRAVLDALREQAGVTRADRLGVRFVNIAEPPPGSPEAWKGWFRPELTGWASTEVVADGARMLTTLTQTQLAAPAIGELSGPPADLQAVIRHGFIPANTVIPGVMSGQPKDAAFLLDIDIFVDAPQPFDVEELARQFDLLHGQIDRFFYWSLAEAGRAHFGLELLK